MTVETRLLSISKGPVEAGDYDFPRGPNLHGRDISRAPVSQGQDIPSEKANLFVLEKGILPNEHELRAGGKMTWSNDKSVEVMGCAI